MTAFDVWCDEQEALADHLRDLENAALSEQPYIGPRCDLCGEPFFVQPADGPPVRPCRCPQPESQWF